MAKVDIRYIGQRPIIDSFNCDQVVEGKIKSDVFAGEEVVIKVSNPDKDLTELEGVSIRLYQTNSYCIRPKQGYDFDYDVT